MYWFGIAALGALHYFYRRGLQADLEKSPADDGLSSAASGDQAPETVGDERGPKEAKTGETKTGEAKPDEAKPDEAKPDETGTGEEKAADVEKAVDPLDMAGQLEGLSDPLERHRIYSRGIELAYGERSKDPAMGEKALTFALAYVDEFPRLKPAVFQSLGESRYVPIFKQLAIMLEEAGAYDKALSLCKKAILLGLDDNTKTGYQGRVNRITKKMG